MGWARGLPKMLFSEVPGAAIHTTAPGPSHDSSLTMDKETKQTNGQEGNETEITIKKSLDGAMHTQHKNDDATSSCHTEH